MQRGQEAHGGRALTALAAEEFSQCSQQTTAGHRGGKGGVIRDKQIARNPSYGRRSVLLITATEYGLFITLIILF